MTGEQKATRADLRAETLRNAEDDAADQRSPERPDTADYDRFKSENELRRSGIR